MTLIETGTRTLLGAVSGPTATGETDYARRLLHLLDASMLVLWDKGFDSNTFLAEVAATQTMLVGRLKSDRRLPVIAGDPGDIRTRTRSPKGRTRHPMTTPQNLTHSPAP